RVVARTHEEIGTAPADLRDQADAVENLRTHEILDDIGPAWIDEREQVSQGGDLVRRVVGAVVDDDVEALVPRMLQGAADLGMIRRIAEEGYDPLLIGELSVRLHIHAVDRRIGKEIAPRPERTAWSVTFAGISHHRGMDARNHRSDADLEQGADVVAALAKEAFIGARIAVPGFVAAP